MLTLGDTNLTALIFNLTANSTNPAVDLDSVRVTGNNHIWEIDLEKDELNKTIKVIISAFNLVGSGEETEPIYIITRNACKFTYSVVHDRAKKQILSPNHKYSIISN